VGALQDQLNAKANVTTWNQGVFALNASYVDLSEHNPYWSSSLFNEVYLRNDVPRKYAQT
jgi:hypothetical protein